MISMKRYVTFFAALADENRLRLLHLMKEGEICVCFLQGTLKTNQPKISRHLAYLRRAGLVDARREGRWMHYRLQKLPTELNQLLNNAFLAIANEPEIEKDNRRAKQIQCAPARFGLNSPTETKVSTTPNCKC
jgi:ArsR family transcriptional regulator, arsenate/arsenite/antimonite-responsive transcriptional repressor